MGKYTSTPHYTLSYGNVPERLRVRFQPGFERGLCGALTAEAPQLVQQLQAVRARAQSPHCHTVITKDASDKKRV